jgi:outer membrane protein assembly factor BamB
MFRSLLLAAATATASVNCVALAGGNTTAPEVRWTFKTKGNIIGGVSAYGPVVGGDTVFVAYPNQLYAVNIATGVERWKFGPADTGGSICEYTGGRGCLCTIPALSVDGATVIVGSQDSILYAVDTTTGVLRWSFRANQTVYQQMDTCASPVFGADNGVFYGTFAGYLHGMCVCGGGVVWVWCVVWFVRVRVHVRVCMCACVCVCVRACVRAKAFLYHSWTVPLVTHHYAILHPLIQR